MAEQNRRGDAARTAQGARGAQGMSVAEVAAVHHLTSQQAKAIKDQLKPAKSSGGDVLTAISTAIVMFAVLAIMLFFGK